MPFKMGELTETVNIPPEELTIRNAEFVRDSLQKLVVERSISLREFLEILGPRLTSVDVDEREKALECVVSVVGKLPHDFLESREVELLLNFLIGRIDDSIFGGGAAIAAINYLVLCSKHLPVGCENDIIQKIFGETNVQAWSQKDRFALYEVLQHLINHRMEGLRSLGADFILSFMRAVTGERDPRCLMIVFQLFYTIVRNFPIGPFVEDMFDIVACYFPIEFKPTNDISGITRDLLVSMCEECLVAHNAFAPFTYQLVAEKLIDDEVEEKMKLEMCSFLSRACNTFPALPLHQQLDDILAGIRTVILNPASGCTEVDVPKPVEEAIQAIVGRFADNFEEGPRAISYLCENLLENTEPFVLQTELGMTPRSLGLLEILVRSCAATSTIIIEQVFKWLLILIKGDTVNVAASRLEIIASSAKYLPLWCRLACLTKNETVVLNNQERFIKLLQNLEEDGGPKIKSVEYALGEVFISYLPYDEENSLFYDLLLNRCPEDVNSGLFELRSASLSFVRAFSSHNWSVFSKHAAGCLGTSDSPFTFPILCSLIHNLDSMLFALPKMKNCFSSATAWTTEALADLVNIFVFNKAEKRMTVELLQQLLSSFFSFSIDEEPESLADMAGALQDIGMTLDNDEHGIIVQFLVQELKARPQLLPLVYLLILQSSNTEEIIRVVEDITNDRNLHIKILLMAAAVNKSENYEMIMNNFGEMISRFDDFEKLKYDGCICRGLLLAGRSQGLSLLDKCLVSLENSVESVSSDRSTQALIDIIDFESRFANPLKCAYRCTILWRQRIFTLFVRKLVEHYSFAKSDAARVGFYRLLAPLFTSAKKIDADLTNEYLQLLPIFCDALDAADLAKSSEETIINAMLQLLKTAPVSDLREKFIGKAVSRFHHLVSSAPSMMICIHAIECLETLARRCEPSSLFSFYPIVIKSLTIATGSHKRLVRSAAANAKNLWELLPTR